MKETNDAQLLETTAIVARPSITWFIEGAPWALTEGAIKQLPELTSEQRLVLLKDERYVRSRRFRAERHFSEVWAVLQMKNRYASPGWPPNWTWLDVFARFRQARAFDATIEQYLTDFPPASRAADAELAAIRADWQAAPDAMLHSFN